MRGQEATILKFIGGTDKAFIIPPFQRNYEWGSEQCKELFNDILESCKSNRTHYLGNITYYEGDNNGASCTELILIDGQQRVTTILILLCALRDLIKDQTKKEKINRQYLMNEDANESYRIRLKQNMYDASSFESIIDGKKAEKTESNVVKNYNLFKKLIAESKIDPSIIFETIPKLEVVDVNLQVKNDLKAVQTVFEKINSTGKPLMPADLIRNLILLASSSKEQTKLYTNYWVEIENRLKSENVSRFARDFLIMKTHIDVLDKQTYSTFKEYFVKIGEKNEEILKEMLEFSKYYEWIRFEKCPNSEINRCIKILNLIKTDDIYPLYLYLLFRIYDTNPIELLRILKLLVNFLIRYRIVSPSGGGGAMRSIVSGLIKGLTDGTLKFTHDDFYFELSNSPTLAGRYPDDTEFKNQLVQNINQAYAKVLFLKLEEFETRNIPVDINAVTVEHLMPQSLSSWWKTNLGRAEESERIYSTYLNSIGNLTPVSQGYNSSMSNKSWPEKLEKLGQVQFAVTAEIFSKYKQWNEEALQERNEDIANRAIKAITGPLPRTRQFTASCNESYQPGIYPASDVMTPMAYSSPITIYVGERELRCEYWTNYVALICGEMLERDKNLFRRIVEQNQIHKSTKKNNGNKHDPIITTDAKQVVLPVKIADSPYFCEGSLSNDAARKYAKQILELFNCLDEFEFEII
jgi:uncharacterized protein with ParB-like and HNH nuclease domain